MTNRLPVELDQTVTLHAEGHLSGTAGGVPFPVSGLQPRLSVSPTCSVPNRYREDAAPETLPQRPESRFRAAADKVLLPKGTPKKGFRKKDLA